MGKKRKAEAAAVAAPKGRPPSTPSRSRKSIARANRRARPRDDYYEAEDAEAPDTQRFDVSEGCVDSAEAKVVRRLATSPRAITHPHTPPPHTNTTHTTTEGRQLRVRDAVGL